MSKSKRNNARINATNRKALEIRDIRWRKDNRKEMGRNRRAQLALFARIGQG